MKVLAVIANKRVPLAGFVSSTIVMLLLSWHVSFKANASEAACISVEQNVLPVVDVSIDDHDFEWAVPIESSFKFTQTTTSPNFSVIPSLYLRQTALPYSRAPPKSL
jgi:hypothetical protein